MRERDTVKTVIAALFTIYFSWCAYAPETMTFFHLINLPIHEAGHIFFRILGEFMGVAGGSLFQIIVPVVFFGYFLYHRKPFSASVVLFWVGGKFLDVYVYAADAVVMRLPLLSGLTGAEGGFHDWNYLLSETGALGSTQLIAKMLRFSGTVLIIAAAAGAFICATKGEEIVSDTELWKFTLITGASSGIGEVFARRLAAAEHNLVLVARSEKKLHELCDELMLQHKIIAHYVALDLNDFEADRRLFEETERHGFEVEWLINNAGFGSMGDFARLELERELEIINLNIAALVALTHMYLEKMAERGKGTIINVSSSASFQPVPFMATYAATKAFVTSFSEALAEENRPHGIRVLALCPGPTETNFFNAANISNPAQLKGMQTPEEVVDTALQALRRGKSLIVSGWSNYIGSVLGNIVPNSVVTRVVGNVLRQKVEGKKG